MEFFMAGITLLLITAAIIFIYKKRKSVNAKGGPRSYVAPAAFLSIPILSLLAYLFDFVGLISWVLIFVLFFVAAYYTKYLPRPKGGDHYDP